MENQEIIDVILDEKSWVDNNKIFLCHECNRQEYGSFLFINTEIRICEKCVYEILIKLTRKIDLSVWDKKDIIKALKEENLFNNIIVLSRIFFIKYKYKNESGDLFDLANCLIDKLGHLKHKFISPLIRLLAVDACFFMGKDIIPLLLEKAAKYSWQMQANIIIVLGDIDNKNKDFHQLLYDGINSSNIDLSKFLKEYFLDNFISHSAAQDRTLFDKYVNYHVKNTDNKFCNVSFNYLYNILNKTYSAEKVLKIYDNFLKDIISVESFFGIKDKVMKKHTIILLTAFFYDKNLFILLFNKLSDIVKRIFVELVYETSCIEINNLEQSYNISIINITGSGYKKDYTIELPFIFFSVVNNHSMNYYGYSNKDKYYFTFNYELSETLKIIVPKPDYAKLIPVKDLQIKNINEEKNKIIENIIPIYTYIKQGNIQYNKNGKTISKLSINNMMKYCQIKEFYNEQNLSTIKCESYIFLIQFIKNINYNNPLQLLKSIIETFFSSNESLDLCTKLKYISPGHYINNYYYYDDEYNNTEIRCRSDIKKLLTLFSVGEWYNFVNIAKHIIYNVYYFNIINPEYINRNSYKFREMSNDNMLDYNKFIIEPFLKFIFFTLSSFGVIDIVYTAPYNNEYRIRYDKNYLSIYDGLTYVRLTELGAYLIGKTDKFETSYKPKSAEVKLDINRLLITLSDKDFVKEIFLKTIATQINPACYLVTYKSFLKDCKTKKDIEQKIINFKNTISNKLPDNWNIFFMSTLHKINPLEHKPDYFVFQVDKYSEFIDLITINPQIKKLILKAEDYHILVKKSNLPALKKHFEAYGFLLDKLIE